jgi:iron complex outermembrane receptor protein
MFKFSPLAAAACLLCNAAPMTAFAADEPATTDKVVISGQRAATPVRPVPSTIESVGAVQIEESINSATTAGLLQYLPSTHVRERYIGDRNGVLVMRVNSSVASAQTTVYADGLLLSNFLNNSFSTAPRWGMVSPEEIERVEVLYGPFSAQYPGNSAGGVVRMVTRTPTRFEAHVKVDAFSEHFKEYGTNARFGGQHASVSLGNAAGAFSYWLSVDHLDNQSHPQTYGNTTAKTGAAATAGTFTVVDSSRVIRDVDTAGNPRIIVSSLGIDHTVQDMAKLKLGFKFGPQLQASYTLGIWQNKSDGSVDSYLRDASGNTVYNAGASMSGAFKFVRIDGKDYTLSAAVPSRSGSEHWMHGLALKGGQGDWSWDVNTSLYTQKKDYSRTAAPTNGLDDSLGATRPGGQLTDAAGTGWRNLDAQLAWRWATGHTLLAGVHHDQYKLANTTLATTDWLSSDTGTLSTNSYGRTITDAGYLQDEWKFAPDWSAMLGLRGERWQALGGSNYNAANTAPNPKTLVYGDRSAHHFSPKLHLAWQAQPDVSLQASYGKGVRYPTVSEIFQTFTGPNNVKTNDPNLKPEQVSSSELSAERRWEQGTLRASYFHEEKRDALISQTDTTVTPNISSIQNVDTVRTDGIEVSGQASNWPWRGLDLQASSTYTRSMIGHDARNPALDGSMQPRIPDWRATLVATWHASEALSASLAYRFSGRQHNALLNTSTRQYNDPNPNVYGAVSHYSVIDAKLLYRFNRNWSASVGVNNLGNFKYYVNPNPYPQRTWFGSLKFDI